MNDIPPISSHHSTAVGICTKEPINTITVETCQGEMVPCWCFLITFQSNFWLFVQLSSALLPSYQSLSLFMHISCLPSIFYLSWCLYIFINLKLFNSLAKTSFFSPLLVLRKLYFSRILAMSFSQILILTGSLGLLCICSSTLCLWF